MDLTTHSSRSNTVGFWFSSRASSGPFGWIFDSKVREKSWIFWPFCCEVWKRSDAILGEKSPRRWNPFKTRFPPLSFYYKEQSTANSNSFKIAQKTAFEAKGRLYTSGEVIQRLFIIDLYTQLGEANGKSSTFAINNRLPRQIVWAPCGFDERIHITEPPFYPNANCDVWKC